MNVKIGISPIAWQNDDLPGLTADYTMEQALREAAQIGFTGVERGQRMPRETDALRVYLEEHKLALCGGWCSGSLLINSVSEEQVAVRQQVEQFAALESPCVVYAECSNTIQGDIKTPLSLRPRLSRDELRSYAGKLGELTKWMADMGQPLAYHHHMGSIIESQEDLNWLMEDTPDDVHLLFDTGHLCFGGGDVIKTLHNWRERVLHVHFKDVRPDVIQDVRTGDKSFLDAVIAGAFTVPGDVVIDFQAVANELKAMDYSGWIVIEAEQDPAKAAPYVYSESGFKHVVDVCSKAGLNIAPTP